MGKPKRTQGGSKVVLEVKNLSKTFTSGTEELVVLDKLELSVVQGKSLAILGSSGSGKSTLLYILGGLDRPTSGQVLSEGQVDIFKLSDSQRAKWRAKNVGFVFQFHHLLPEFDALENVAMPLLLSGVPAAQAKERALPLLERVGLGDRLNHRPGILSGGEQQRVALARALVMEPTILLADEPTGNLDNKNAKLVNELIIELVKETGMAAIVVTHNAALADMLDRRVTLEMGTLKG
ncbi:MAG: ABC transporter ATP-binding protein [Deltaproteobacteria bacterium]|nr:ABC transporter ATP-binding protein [Deltaproteobacteria bacterium]